jgi:prefoldin subunit 5
VQLQQDCCALPVSIAGTDITGVESVGLVVCVFVQAAAQEAVWAKQIATSDSRADNAEGMATAMHVSVKQLEKQLQQRQQEAASKEGEC